jgi:hypothetical protein
MNNKNIFSILLAIAFFGILAQSQFNFGPKYDTLILVAVGFTPLIAYKYYLGSRDTLTQNEIDSIYYFGFLVTLIVLGATALRLVFFSAQIESVAAQFGLGLLATGFGLWSRLTLLTKNVTTDASDELLQRQLNHIGQITERFSETVELFKNLRDEAVTRSQDAMRATTSAAMQKLSDELSQPLNALSLNIIAVTDSLGKFDSRTFNNIEINAKALSDSIPDTTESISKLRDRVTELDLSLKSPTLELTNFYDKLKSSNAELVGLPNNLNELKSSSNLMKSSIEEAALSLQRFSKIDFSELPSLISGYIKISEEISKITLQITSSPQLIGTETANFKVTLDNLSKEMKAKSDELNQASKFLTDSLSKMAYSIHNAIDKLPK